MHAALSRCAHEAAEMRIELRRAAGDVERVDLPSHEHVEHEVDCIALHFLGAVRSRIDVAMHAGLVAAIADIDLQRLKVCAPYGEKGDALEKGQRIAHGV